MNYHEIYKPKPIRRVLTMLAFFVFSSLTACTAVSAYAASNQQAKLSTPAPATPSRVPTASVNYQATAAAALTAEVSARSTAQSANIIVAQITAEQDQRSFQQGLWTVTSEAMAYQRQSMTQQASYFTATAYATSFPATQTRQSKIDDARTTETYMTITAPTRVKAMAQSETYAKYSDKIQVSELVFQLAVSLFVITLSVMSVSLLVSRWTLRHIEKPLFIPNLNDEVYKPIPQAPAETVIQIETGRQSGFPRTDRMVVPCTPQQFTLLASGILKDGLKFDYAYWNSRTSPDHPAPFTRSEFTAVRQFLQEKRFVKSAGNGSLVLTSEGETLFIEWLDSQKLPSGYNFEEQEQQNEQE